MFKQVARRARSCRRSPTFRHRQFCSIGNAAVMPRVSKMKHRKKRPAQRDVAKPPEQPERPDDQALPRSEQASVTVVETHRFSHEELAQLLWLPDFVATMLRELLHYPNVAVRSIESADLTHQCTCALISQNDVCVCVACRKLSSHW